MSEPIAAVCQPIFCGPGHFFLPVCSLNMAAAPGLASVGCSELGGVYDMASSGNMAPSKQAKDVFAVLAAEVDVELAKLKSILDTGLKAFNKMIREKELPVVVIN